jgi:hypothetical protein
MLRSFAVVLSLTILPASVASAQMIFAPVQYQYGEGANRYYYGGDDPAVFYRAEQRRRLDELGDHPLTSERYTDAYVHRRLTGQLDRVYSDAAPHVNARIYGYLPVDTANDAYANVPCHFRMADLLASAVEQPDGTRVVSPYAKPIRKAEKLVAAPTTRPRAIIILPRPAIKRSDKLLTTASR